MDYLFDKWSKLSKDLSNKFIFLFLDYDGTISPIADAPNRAVISKQTKGLLQKIALRPNRKVAIISGRALEDIKNRIGLKNIIYVGNHGLEVEGPNIEFQYPLAPGYRSIIRNIDKGLKHGLRGLKGVLIENKSICLSLHYRLAKKKDIPLIKAIFKGATLPYIVSEKVKMSSGKKLLEVKPPVNWNKGSVAKSLLAIQKDFLKSKSIISIYIGDDLTDEDAFKALRKKEITIFVGKPRASLAKYYLKNTSEVIKFLKLIAEV